MNFRLTSILTIVLVLLIGLVYFAQREGVDTKPKEPEHKLLATAPKAVEAVTLARDNKTVAAFQKTADKWALTEPLKAPVETWQIDSVADALKTLSYRDKFAAEPSGLKSLEGTGVEPASAVVKFTDSDKVEHTLAVGKRTPVGTRYVRIDKDPDVYEVDGSWFDKLDKDPAEFRSKDLLEIASDRITALTLETPKQTLQADKRDGKWTITKPITTRANTTVFDDMATALNSLRVESFTDITPDSAGLTPPVLTVTVQAKDKDATPSPAPATSQPATQPKVSPTTIQFGNYADLTKKNVYATVSGHTEVYVLNADIYKKFDKTLFAARDAAVTPAAVDDATALEISAPVALNLTRKDGTWTLQNPAITADMTTVSAVLTALKNLRANKFVDAPGDLKAIGLAPAERTITLTLPGQTQRETILIGHAEKAEPLTPVQRQGEPTVFLVQTADLAKLSPELLTLRDKAVAKFPADALRSIAISGPAVAAPLSFVHTGTTWTVNGKTADSAKVTTLLSDLDPLSAQRWTTMAPHAGATPDLQVDIVSTQAAATQPATLPAVQAAGPQVQHQVTRTVLLYRGKETAAAPTTAPAVATWSATLTPADATTWTFEPTATLIEHLTKTTYEAPTTAPATAPATAP